MSAPVRAWFVQARKHAQAGRLGLRYLVAMSSHPSAPFRSPRARARVYDELPPCCRLRRAPARLGAALLLRWAVDGRRGAAERGTALSRARGLDRRTEGMHEPGSLACAGRLFWESERARGLVACERGGLGVTGRDEKR